MKTNPADTLGSMWGFLQTFGQKEDIPQLKESVYDLIQLMTQKTGGQEHYRKGNEIDFNDVNMVMCEIVIEAAALVLSGRLEGIEYEGRNDYED